MSAAMRQRILAKSGVQPNWIGSEIPKIGFIPWCSEKCRYFADKRCSLTLLPASGGICTPAVQAMSEALDQIEEVLR